MWTEKSLQALATYLSSGLYLKHSGYWQEGWVWSMANMQSGYELLGGAESRYRTCWGRHLYRQVLLNMPLHQQKTEDLSTSKFCCFSFWKIGPCEQLLGELTNILNKHTAPRYWTKGYFKEQSKTGKTIEIKQWANVYTIHSLCKYVVKELTEGVQCFSGSPVIEHLQSVFNPLIGLNSFN